MLRRKWGVFYYNTNNKGLWRIALRIKKKTGNAVIRNKMRRRIKVALKKALSEKEAKGLDVFLIWSGGEIGFKELNRIFADLLENISYE